MRVPSRDCLGSNSGLDSDVLFMFYSDDVRSTGELAYAYPQANGKNSSCSKQISGSKAGIGTESGPPS